MHKCETRKQTFTVEDMETSKDVVPAHKTQSDEYTANFAVFKSSVELIICGGVPNNVGTVGPSKTESDRFCGTFIGILIHARMKEYELHLQKRLSSTYSGPQYYLL
jgi:hypothetical protein